MKLSIRPLRHLSVALVMLLAACLNENPKGLLFEEEAYNSAANLYNNAVATLYN